MDEPEFIFDDFFEQGFDELRYRNLIKQGKSEEEAFAEVWEETRKKIESDPFFKETGYQFFMSYKQTDLDRSQSLPFILNDINALDCGFFDIQSIPMGEVPNWRFYVRQAINKNTMFLLFWSGDSHKSSAIEEEIKLASETNAMIIVVRLDSSPLPEITKPFIVLEPPLFTRFTASYGEELVEIALWIKALFDSDLNRRVDENHILNLDLLPVYARLYSRHISRLGEWYIQPDEIRWYADFMHDMLELGLDDGTIPVDSKVLKAMRDTEAYQELRINDLDLE